MLDALLGAAIMVVATTSLLYSIEVAEKAFGCREIPFKQFGENLLDDLASMMQPRLNFLIIIYVALGINGVKWGF